MSSVGDVLGTVGLWYGVFLVAVVAHEAAHAWVGHRGGSQAAGKVGLVTINPWAHMRREPMGMILLPLFCLAVMKGQAFAGYGRTPYDAGWAKAHPRRALGMIVAGPAVNLALVVAAIVALRMGLAGGVFVPALAIGPGAMVEGVGSAWDWAGRVLSVTVFVNTVVFAFNLLPIPPLDGWAALATVVSERTRDRIGAALRNPVLVVLLVVFLANAGSKVVYPVFGATISAVYAGVEVFGVDPSTGLRRRMELQTVARKDAWYEVEAEQALVYGPRRNADPPVATLVRGARVWAHYGVGDWVWLGFEGGQGWGLLKDLSPVSQVSSSQR